MAVFLLALCVLSGAVGLMAPALSGGPHLPMLASWLWYGLLVAGGTTGLVGAAWRDPVAGVLIVRAGMLPLGTGALALAAWLALAGNGRDVLSWPVIGMFGLCAHWRAVQITAHLRELRRSR